MRRPQELCAEVDAGEARSASPSEGGERPPFLEPGRRGRAQARQGETLQLVAFTVGDGEYALDIMRIKEIIQPVKVRAVPKAPSFIEGVIELRGAILPVIDLRRRFDLPAAEPTRATKFLVAVIEVPGEGGGLRRMVVALVVDGVSEPLRILREHIRPAPPLAQGTSNYFSGVIHWRGARQAAAAPSGVERRRSAQRGPALPDEPARRGEDRIFMILDLDAVLSSTEKISLSGAAAQLEGGA